MAMNKSEKARLDEAERKLAAAMALGWPHEAKPSPVDVRAQLEGTEFGTLFVGWASWTYGDTYQVAKGCSSGCSHSIRSTTETTSQGGGRFFHSRQDALLAARWELCERFAEALAQLDAELEST